MASEQAPPGEGSTSERAPTSGLVMRTWFGTDSSTTQPQVQHHNPRSAARAAAVQKKKPQLETAQNTNTYRVIHPSSTIGNTQSQAMAPPPIPSHAPYLPARRMDHREVQVPRVTGKRATDTRDRDAESSTASASTSQQSGQVSLNASTSAGHIGSRPGGSYTQVTHEQPNQQPIATDLRLSQRLRLDPLASSGRLRPASWTSSSSQCSSQSAARLPEIVPTEGFPEDDMDIDGLESISMQGTGTGKYHGGKGTTGQGTTNAKEVNMHAENGFNAGWRRFGPVGRDIADYVSHYPSTPKIDWPSELTTIAPFLPDERFADEVRNKLQRHQNYLENATKKFRSSRERPDLCMHVPYKDARDAMRQIRECMKKGIPLAFDDFPDSVLFASTRSSAADGDPFMDPIRWSQDYNKGNIGACLPTPRTFRDSALREARNSRPVVTATLSDFKEWLKSPCIIRGISDVPCGLRQADDITDRISDNVVQNRQDRFGKGYRGHRIIVHSMMSNDWFDVSTAGFLTFGHIDYSGVARTVHVRGSGMQQIIIFSSRALPIAPSDASREERKELQKQLLTGITELAQAANNSNLETRAEARARKGKAAETGSKDGDVPSTSSIANPDKIDGCILELRPGMKLYQPSGTVFATYTPVPTATAGKRFFTYGDLHRVELFRRVQYSKDGRKRNEHNCGVQLTLMAMAAGLPSRTANKEGKLTHL
ncbi:uncharacterized protein SCHCODRAFT_01175067 [Schizophyllum commune H4-8]|nr:uncharacterized protein SCHCODRAFT_01175067 [Schizophyllum commune H4-8]KAI5887833.1 hypothetical protein SCHCODRAFT_01175067 [Schizophyllum commune H4-8]